MQSTTEQNRKEAQRHNDEQKKVAADRLKKNAEYNKAHRIQKDKQ